MRRLGRRGLRLAGAAALALLCSGCWDSLDPKDLNVAVGLAFDRGPQGLAAIAEVPSVVANRGTAPSAPSGSPGSPVFLLSGQGPDVPAALQQMAEASGKAPYWGQLYSILLTTSLSRQGIGPVMDTLVRIPELSDGTDVVLIEGSAAEFLSTVAQDVQISSLYTREHLMVLGRNLVYPTALWSLYVTLHTPGLAPAVPVFKVAQAVGGPRFQAVGMALFRGDRMASILTGPDAQALLIWMNHLGDGTLSVPFDRDSAALRRVQGRSSLSLARWEGGLPVFRLSVRVSGEVQKTPKGRPAFTQADIRRLEERTSAQVAAQMERVLRRAQDAGADVFGLGAWLRYHDPSAFGSLQSWSRAFPRVRVEISVRTSIFETGILS